MNLVSFSKGRRGLRVIYVLFFKVVQKGPSFATDVYVLSLHEAVTHYTKSAWRGEGGRFMVVQVNHRN